MTEGRLMESDSARFMVPAVRSAGGRTSVKPTLNRRAVAEGALRQREIQWWKQFAHAEEQYSWVLPAEFQPLPRERYLQEISTWLGAPAQVVDYGCGNGWVSRALARRMGCRFLGLDFSASQIALARAASTQFPQVGFDIIGGPEDIPAADSYILHGVLHHLPGNEVFGVLERIARVAPRGARIAVVEPVCFPGNAPDETDRSLLSTIESIVQAPARALRESGGEPGPTAQKIREEAAARWWGELPYGPSPMERPFDRDELNVALAQYFQLEVTKPVQFLGASQALAIELTLLALDAPDLARRIQPELQAAMDLLEGAILKFARPPDSGWYMVMTIARVP